jgi:hypothetical protein
MSTTWSCNIYSSDDEETNDESCVSSHQDPKIDSPSASRPLLYTITMSSGSSGANTFSSMSDSYSLSSSEPSTRAGTPPETPAAELRDGDGLLSLPVTFPQRITNELLMINPALFVSPNSSGQDHGYDDEAESSFSRLVLDSGALSPLGGSECAEEQPLVANSSIWARRTEAARGRVESRGSSPGGSRSRKTSPSRNEKTLDSGEDGGINEVSVVSMPLLRRSRRPAPLDLSAVSCTQPRAHDSSVIGPSADEDLSPNTPKHPFTAPLIRQTNSDMKPEPSHPPATAPFLTMPRAPLIRPSVLTSDRSPSPLTLPSPCLSWSLESASQPTTASTFSTLWSPTSPPPSSLPHSAKKFMDSRRRITLGQQIATLRAVSATGPVPPSLRNSPILCHLSSPRPTLGSPQDLSIGVFTAENDLLSPPTHFIGTPLRRHMNPYFSHPLVADRRLVSHSMGEISPPINQCNPYFAATEHADVAYTE